ncbi:transcriptional regulator ATRX-like [Mytilus trossulus]|uniref:transcriptional regulator ATRX-like n=1 Tax=Mytilus trossulus TaxID=6551 RepID=UPI00300514BD
MNISKKATKFTKQTAIELKAYRDDYDKEELKRTFIEAVKSISKKDIKTEILQNVDKYVKKLDKFLRKSQNRQHVREEGDLPEFDYNLYQPDGHQLQNTEGKTEKERELLVNQIIAERIHQDPEVLNLLDDFPPEDKSFPQLSSCHKLLKLTSGSKHAETLRQIMLKYFRVVQTQAEDLVAGEETDRCSEMATEIRNFVSVCHLRKQHCDQCEDEKKPSYEDILTSLLSLYVELFLQSNRSGNNKNKMGRQLCGFVKYLLPWQQHQLDLLLQLSSVTEEDAEVIIPLARAILIKTEEYPEEKIYLRQVLAVRSLHSKVGDAVDDINETMKSVSAPRKLLSWLRNQDAPLVEEFPNDKKFKGTIVTKFLLEEATEDQTERLTDIFSYNEADDEEESQMDKTPSKGAPSTKQKEDLEQLNFFIDTGVKQDKLESAASEDLFYIDKGGLALGQNKAKDMKDQSEDENEADVAMDTDLNDNVEKMDVEIFHIDTSLTMTLKKDENKHLEEKENEIITSDDQTLEADKHESLEVKNVDILDDNDQSPKNHIRKNLDPVPDSIKKNSRRSRKSSASLDNLTDSENNCKSLGISSSKKKSHLQIDRVNKVMYLRKSPIKSSVSSDVEDLLEVMDKDMHNKSAKKSSKKLASVEVYDGNCIEDNNKRERKSSLTSNEKDLKQESYEQKSNTSLSEKIGNHGDNMDFSLVIEYQGAVKHSDDSGKGNVNRLKIRAQIGEGDSGIENIEDKNEETARNQDKLRRNKSLSESSVASDLSTKGKQSKEQVKTIFQSRNTRRSTRLSECSVSSDLNDEKPESVKDMNDNSKLKESQKKQTQIEKFMVPRYKIKSWQDKFGGQEFQANGADHINSKELSPAVRKTRSGRRISSRVSPEKHSSKASTTETSMDDSLLSLDMTVADDYDSSSSNKRERQKKKQINADDLVVPDSNDEEFEDSPILPNITQFMAKTDTELSLSGEVINSGRKRENDLGTPRSLRKRKRSCESSTPISTKKISEESESKECLEINDSTKKNLPRIIETEEYIVMSEPSSEGQQGESESSEKIEKSKQSKRRQSEPLSKMNTPNKTRRKSEAYSLKKGMTLRTRKSSASHD